jgi:tetratricopeptide (TPR) repeat protein
MKKAIAIVTYSRAHYYSLVLPSILAQRIGDKPISDVYDIYIFQDGLWAGETADNRRGHATIGAMLATHPRKDRVFQQNENLGVALHFDFIEKMLFAAEGYDYVAFCEDDLILAPAYMAALDRMAERFAEDPRVGMMSVHPGNCTVSLEVQREHLGDFAAMGHNWGFGLSRSFWKRRQPFVEQYLDLIRDVPYRSRNTPRVSKWLRLAGFRDDASSQDYIKQCATTALGACRLSTFCNLGLPIGRTGLHCTPEVFLTLGMDRAVVVDQEPRIGRLGDDEFSAVYRTSSDHKDVAGVRMARLAALAAAPARARKAANEPLARAADVKPDSIEALAPILALVSSRLTRDPDWAVPLLELVTGRLAMPMLRRARDESIDRSVAIRAALNVAGHEAADIEDWIILAHLLATEGRLIEALSWVNRVLPLQSHVASHHRLKASVLERLDLPKEALEAVGCALELDPSSADLMADRQRISARHGELLRRVRDASASAPAAALDAAMTLAQRAETPVEDWPALAHLLVRQERDAEALIWIDKIIARTPDVADYLELRAGVLERMARFEEALDDTARACELKPNDARLAQAGRRIESAFVSTLRTRRDQSQDLPVAIDAAHKLAQRNTAAIDDWVALAHMLAKAERLNEALEWASRALQGAPGAVDLHRLYASLLERLYRSDEALCAIKHAMVLHPEEQALTEDRRRIESRHLQSLRERRDNSPDAGAAIEAAQRVVEHDPAKVGDWLALAQLLARSGRLNEALGWVDRALAIDPVAVHLHRFRVTLLEQLGYYRQGYRAAKLAHTLDPGNDDLPRHAKRMLLKAVADSVGMYRPSRTG